MKTVSKIFFLTLLLMSGKIVAQSEEPSTVFNKNGSLVLIDLANGASLGKGLLWKVSDDSIHFVEYSHFSKNIQYSEPPILKIHYSEIAQLRTVPRKAIKNGILIGGAIGMATGLGVGLVTTEDPEPKAVPVHSQGGCILVFCIPPSTQYVLEDEPKDAASVLIKTLAFTAAGTIAGALIGNSKAIKSRIEGSHEAFLAIAPELKSQAFWVSQESLKSKNHSTQKLY